MMEIFSTILKLDIVLLLKEIVCISLQKSAISALFLMQAKTRNFVDRWILEIYFGRNFEYAENQYPSPESHGEFTGEIRYSNRLLEFSASHEKLNRPFWSF